jgi:hypothetical protein
LRIRVVGEPGIMERAAGAVATRFGEVSRHLTVERAT